jgi:hypothetical protein
MNLKYLLFTPMLSWFLVAGSNAQTPILEDVIKSFENIPAKSNSKYVFKTKSSKVPTGGHLQGVQSYFKNNQRHVLITASSSKYSYCLSSVDGRRADLQEILPSPLKHAGGCQIVDDILFVGVEDNLAKDKSVVVEVSVDTHIQRVILNREGTYKRSTAGAVGATKIGDDVLLAVADWDSRNIDFYLSNQNVFDSVASFKATPALSFCSFQSINLITDTANRIFMVGFCKQMNRNRADLFEIKNYELLHLSTRYFNCGVAHSFRYGAGLEVFDKSILSVYVTQRKLKARNSVCVFRLN